MRWPFSTRPEPPIERRVEVVRREASKLTLAEWKRDKNLVGLARNLLSTHEFSLMLDVLKNESPSNSVLPIGTSPDIRAAFQARGEGYSMVFNNIEAMAALDELPASVEATFEPEDKEKGTEIA